MRTRTVRVTWETDGEDIELPELVDVPIHLIDEEVSEYLSDTTGWLVEGWVEVERCEECLGVEGGHHYWCSEESVPRFTSYRHGPLKVHLSRVAIDIFVEGLGTCGMAEGQGQVVSLEKYEGKWVLHVWADINEEDATHRIDLSGALESVREES